MSNLKNVMGIINLINDRDILTEFALDRTVAAIPFGGRYRLIDAVLSNMVNGGITNVGIFVQSKYRSLMDHLRSGKAWDLHRKRDGLFILPPECSNSYAGVYRGDLEGMHFHLDYLERSHQEYVIIAGGNMFCNLDYRQVFNFHQQQQADVTIIYQTERAAVGIEAGMGTVISTKADQRVTAIEVDGQITAGQQVSMEMYIMSKKMLLELIEAGITKGQYDLLKDGLIKNLDSLKIYGYDYPGYLARINSVANYYRHSMDLLDPAIWQELFFMHGPIYTKVKDEAPSKYLEHAQVKDSLVASGCLIEGEVERSILFRQVAVCKGAVIKNSVIMAKCIIEDGAYLENVILDKDVRITSGKILRGDAKQPMFVGKNIVI